MSPECQGTSSDPIIIEDSPVKVARRADVYRFVGDIDIIWASVLNEVYPTQQEHCNPEDRYADSILKDDLL